jgi:hypothetical protein
MLMDDFMALASFRDGDGNFNWPKLKRRVDNRQGLRQKIAIC